MLSFLARMLGCAGLALLNAAWQGVSQDSRLLEAAARRDTVEVRSLLAAGADPNARDKFDRTA